MQAGLHSIENVAGILKIDLAQRSHDANHFADRDELQMTVAAALAASQKQSPQPLVIIRDLPPQPIVVGPSYVQEYFGSRPLWSKLKREQVLAPLMKTVRKQVIKKYLKKELMMKLIQYVWLIALGTCVAHAMEQGQPSQTAPSNPIAIAAASNNRRSLKTAIIKSQSADTSPRMASVFTASIPHVSSAPALAAAAIVKQMRAGDADEISSSNDDDDDYMSNHSDDARPNTNMASPSHGSPNLSRKSRDIDNDFCEEFAELARSHDNDSYAKSFYLHKQYGAQRHRNKHKKK